MSSEIISKLVAASRAAQRQFEHATQEQADAAARAVCKAVYDNARELAVMAVEETDMGDVEDKVVKCTMKPKLIWNDIKDKKSVGLLRHIEDLDIYEYAKPMGVVGSIAPCTNPIVTPMSNSAFSLKCRNSIIIAPHPRALRCTERVVGLFRKELALLGFPEDLIQMTTTSSVEMSTELMKQVDIIVATGGMGMVKSAYSSGKPALGVGVGNVQCIVDDDADIEQAAADIVTGRCFDNGIICLGEQAVIAPSRRYDELLSALERNGTYVMRDKKEIQMLRDALFPSGGAHNRKAVGKPASFVAELAGLQLPEGTRMIAAEGAGYGGHDEVLCREKMCPVVVLLRCESFEEAVEIALTNLRHEGLGHSVGLHSNTAAHVEYAANMFPVARLIINQPTGTSGGGHLYNGFTPTTSNGCGTWGNNSFSGNFTFTHLMNITRVGFKHKQTTVPSDEQIWA